MLPIEVPGPVRRTALLTESGTAWLEALPDLLADLASRWGLTLGRSLHGGSASYVTAARASDGAEVVLKVALPPGVEGLGPFAVELDALLNGGPGYVRVLAHDRDRGAVLQERLGPPVGHEDLSLRAKLQVISTTLGRAWVPACTVPSATTLAVKGRWLADYIERAWEATGRPCSRRAVDLAIGLARDRAALHDNATALLLHGDGHAMNTLSSPGGYRLIDPDPVQGEPAYDLAIALREVPLSELGADPVGGVRELCELVADPHGVDAEAVWQWAFVERMSTGLLCAKLGHDDWARPLLAVADALAED